MQSNNPKSKKTILANTCVYYTFDYPLTLFVLLKILNTFNYSSHQLSNINIARKVVYALASKTETLISRFNFKENQENYDSVGNTSTHTTMRHHTQSQ